LVVFALVFLFFAWQAPGFLTQLSLVRNILVPASIGAVISLGMTVVMTGSGIDLSVAATAGLAALAAASAETLLDFNLVLMMVVAVIVGALMGALNGAFVAYVGISPFVVTLSSAFLMSGLQSLMALSAVGGTYLMISGDVKKFVREPIVLIGACAVVAILLYIFLDHTTHGRYIRAIGQNLSVTHLSGIKTRFYTWLTYVICGALCAIGGVMLTAREGKASVGSGEGYLIDAFLLPILGQAVFQRFSVEGTIFGALFMYMIIDGLFIMGAPPESMRIVKGALLLAVILASGLQKMRAD
jgi:ribose/xylose/arabinose/galactoside ABC-type transport system permease subunit